MSAETQAMVPELVEEEDAAERYGRDEMNLVEFPFALLADRAPQNLELLRFSDTIQGPKGKRVKRTWTVRGSEGLGLPTPFEEALYVVLMELTQEQGFESRKVHFTRYELARRLGMPDKGQTYPRLKQGLQRLLGTQIDAENAFWDSTTRQYASVGFHLIDDYELYEEPAGRKPKGFRSLARSSVTWNEVLFESMKRGYVKRLDVRLFLSLSSNVARRLYRYLDKKRYKAADGSRSKTHFSIGLEKLAITHLGLTRQPPAHLKRHLDRAHQELLRRRFLEAVEYQPGRDGKEKVVYTFGLRSASEPEPPLALPEGVTPPPEVPTDPQEAELKLLVDALLERGMGKIVARRLVREHPEEVRRQLEYLPHAEVKSTPAAYLRKAIEEGWGPPAALVQRQQREQKRQGEARKRDRRALRESEEREARQRKRQALEEARGRLSPEELQAREEHAREAVLLRHPHLRRLDEQGRGASLKRLVEEELARQLLADCAPEGDRA